MCVCVCWVQATQRDGLVMGNKSVHFGSNRWSRPAVSWQHVEIFEKGSTQPWMLMCRHAAWICVQVRLCRTSRACDLSCPFAKLCCCCPSCWRGRSTPLVISTLLLGLNSGSPVTPVCCLILAWRPHRLRLTSANMHTLWLKSLKATSSPKIALQDYSNEPIECKFPCPPMFQSLQASSGYITDWNIGITKKWKIYWSSFVPSESICDAIFGWAGTSIIKSEKWSCMQQIPMCTRIQIIKGILQHVSNVIH